MSTIDTLRANVMAAVRSLLPSNVDLVEAKAPEASFAVAIRKPGVVVAYAGKPKKEEGPVGKRGSQGYSYAFSIAIIGEDFASPAGAVYEAANVAELILGSPSLPPYTPNLRTIQLGTINGEDVYLKFISEGMTPDPNSTPQGGRFAIVQSWETAEIRQ